MNPDSIFTVYRIRPQADGSIKRQVAGRFIEHEGELHILEDYFGTLSHLPEGPITERTNRMLQSLRGSSYLEVVSQAEKGRRFDLLPVHTFNPAQESQEQYDEAATAQPRPSQFEYIRDGQTHLVEFRNGQCYLDGQQLDEDEGRRLLQHHRQGIAVVRYVRNEKETE